MKVGRDTERTAAGETGERDGSDDKAEPRRKSVCERERYSKVACISGNLQYTTGHLTPPRPLIHEALEYFSLSGLFACLKRDSCCCQVFWRYVIRVFVPQQHKQLSMHARANESLQINTNFGIKGLV